MTVTDRVARKVRKDFSEDAEVILDVLSKAAEDLTGAYVGSSTVEDRERVLAAAVVLAQGNVDDLLDSLELMLTDWRDLLVEAGLAHEGWRSQLDAIFGPPSSVGGIGMNEVPEQTGTH